MCKTSNTQKWKKAQLEIHQLPSLSREAGQAADPTPGSSPGNTGRGPTRPPFPRHHPREVKADATQTRARRPHAGPKASATAGSQEGMGVLGRMQHRHTRTTRPAVVNGPLSGNEGGHPLSSAPHPEDFLEEEKIVSRPFERSDRRGCQGRLCPQTCHRHSPGASFVFRSEIGRAHV